MKLFQSVRKFLSRLTGRFGSSTGEERGPGPGYGAVIHNSSGEADFDGSSGNTRTNVKDPKRHQPYPPEKSAD